MGTEGVVTFCQSELQRTSFAAFDDMRKRGQFCDLTIRVQNHSLSAHRVILAAAIPCFHSLFTSSKTETEEKEIAVEDLDPKALESLVYFAYTSKVIISVENVHSLLLGSQFLELNQVRDACVEFISARLSVDSVIQTRTFAWSLNNSNLIENSDCFIRKNFEELSKSDDFLTLSHSCIKDIISEDDLNVSSEQITYEAVMKWVKNSPSERYDMLPELLAEVRMIYLPHEYMMEQVDSDEFIKTSLPCRDLINDVKNYHLLPKKRSELSNLKTLPRNSFNKQDLYAICAIENHGYSVHRFDFTDEKWSKLASKEGLLCKTVCSVIAVNEKIYMFLKDTIQIFHTKTFEWKELVPRRKCIEGAAIVANGEMIYCFGSSEKDYQYVVRCFCTQQNEWKGETRMKTGCWNRAAASLGDSIYVTGGYEGVNLSGNVEKYHPLANQFRVVASMLTPRSIHGCTAMNGKIYVCGGCTNNYTRNTAEVYDPLIDQWKFISCMENNNPRHRLTLVSHKRKIFAIGGNEVGNLNRCYDVEIYDPEIDHWKTGFKIPIGFKGAVSIP